MLRKLLTEEYISERLSIEDICRSLKAIQQKLEEELAGKQKIIDGSWQEIKDLRITIQKKDATIQQLQTSMAESQRNNEGNRQIINKLLNDLERAQQDIDWYKRTYETRSLMGIIKDKIKTVFVNNK